MLNPEPDAKAFRRKDVLWSLEFKDFLAQIHKWAAILVYATEVLATFLVSERN